MLHPYVGSEHLLIGILRVDGCVAVRILDGARLRPLLRARGGDRAHQGARGVASRRRSCRSSPSTRATSRRSRSQGGVRPARRPRRGGRADRPDPLAPHEEQPDPPRRAGRRQDRDRRGAGAADRRGAACRSSSPQRKILALDLSLIVAGTKYRGQFEERLKGILKELQGEPGPHRLHRRDPLADRRRIGRGLARRREHPEAGAVARRDRLHRRDDAQGVPQVHREGPLAPAALPGDHRRPAGRGGDAADPRGGPRALREVPPRPLHAPTRSRPPSTSRAATSRTASCPTRRSTSSTRPARR